MLNLDLHQVDRGEVHIGGAIPVDHPVWVDTGLSLLEPVVVDLRANRVVDNVLVRGSIRTALEIPCRRCLTVLRREVADTVDLLFAPPGDEQDASGEVYPLPPRGSVLDLLEPVREQVLLRAPAYAVCRKECRGFCPQCGTNRNETACDCAPEAGLGPWDALKTISFD